MLKELHGLRGVAILNVIIVHVFGAYGFFLSQVGTIDMATQRLQWANEIAWHGSTIYFALISGLLFSRVLVTRGWRRFFRNKLLNVILPYAVMTVLFTFVWYRPLPGEGLMVNADSFQPFISQVASNFVFGTTILIYWYIPVLACLFAATPAIYYFAKRNSAVIGVLAILPLFFTRTGVDVTIQSIIYYIGVYTVGIYAGINYERNLSFMRVHFGSFALISVATTISLWYFLSNDIDFIGSVSTREALFYIQKLSLAPYFWFCFTDGGTNSRTG